MIERWEVQNDAQHSEVKYEVKDSRSMSIDAHSLADADDVTVSLRCFRFLLKKNEHFKRLYQNDV